MPSLSEWLIKKSFRPKKSHLSERGRELLKSAEVQDFPFMGQKVKVYFWLNQGPLVYLAHGWGGRGLSFHRLIEELMQSGFSVVSFDGVAHGDSSGESTSFIEFLHLNTLLLKKLDPPELCIGHSMGGAALINAFSELDLDIPVVLIAPMYSFSTVIENIKKRTSLPSFVVNYMIRGLEKKFDRRAHQLETQDKVKSLEAPSLILHDPKDEMTYIENSRKLCDAWANCELIELNGAGHSRILLDPRCISKVLQFAKDRS